MIPLVIRLPLDPYGTSPDNKVVGEPHTLSGSRIRAIATNSGAFFSDSMVVVDTLTGRQLTKDQYYAAELYQFPSQRYGAEICAIVIVTDPTVSNTVTVTYQALGGEFSTSQQAIIQQIENLQLDTRPVAWPDIIGKPNGFTPSAHLHDAGDIYGFEYLVFAIDRVRDAILLGDVASHDAIYAYIDHLETVLRALIAQGSGGLTNHVNDKNNPHQVTAGQINVFTKQETNALLAQSLAALSASVNARIDQEVAQLVSDISTLNSNINAHIGNHNNPHGVTAAQIGAMTEVAVTALVSTSVNNSAATINNRISQEVATLTAANQATATALDQGLLGVYRGHAPLATSGSGTSFTVTLDTPALNFFNHTNIMAVAFHVGNGGAPTVFTLYPSGLQARLYQFGSDGGYQDPVITPGMISDVRWNGNAFVVMDALPPVVKPALSIEPTVPTQKTSDSVIVTNAGILDWKTVGGFSGYFSKDIGKLFYDVGPMRPYTRELNGDWVSKAAEPWLWAWVQSSGFLTIPQYYGPGMFYFVDIDANTFALPDLRNMFVRGSGTDDLGSVRPPGYVQTHQLGSHNHTVLINAVPGHFHGSGWGESQPGDNRHGIYDYTRGVGSGRTDYDNFDNKTSTDGAHTHTGTVGFSGGLETRPTNVAMSPRIQII